MFFIFKYLILHHMRLSQERFSINGNVFLKHVQKVEKLVLKNVPLLPPLSKIQVEMWPKKIQFFFKIWWFFPPKRRTWNRIFFFFFFFTFVENFTKQKSLNPHLQTCFTLAIHIISLNGIDDISQIEHMYHLECFCKKTGIKMLFYFKPLA